ncbi:hypothetical protein GCM10022223_44870 [Kineosporia mesophila]|uniref:Uncharacterized protein n=1 Tax=Kineosporia mesophila TaxID=566012 RepID=A0ABP6ZYW8_9ACTN
MCSGVASIVVVPRACLAVIGNENAVDVSEPEELSASESEPPPQAVSGSAAVAAIARGRRRREIRGASFHPPSTRTPSTGKGRAARGYKGMRRSLESAPHPLGCLT